MKRPVILLVEDDPGDVRLMREAFRSTAREHDLHVVPDGVEALAFLRSGTPRPSLVFLDLNLPRKDGREVLAEVKADPDLQSIPIVVMTCSSADQDVERAYALHANAFVSKPLDYREFVDIVLATERWWFDTVRLPS